MKKQQPWVSPKLKKNTYQHVRISKIINLSSYVSLVFKSPVKHQQIHYVLFILYREELKFFELLAI